MSAMTVASFNGCKVYNLTGTKSLPMFLTDNKKRQLSKDDDYRRRLELIQDFEMTTATQCVKMTADGEHIIITGGYPPMVRCYTVSDLAQKFQRGLTSDVVAFECLSDNYGKLAFLQADRTLAFHAPYGKHYDVRIPKFGRDLVYGWENCDMYVGTSGKEVYRLNLESGQFKEPFELENAGCNKLRINQVHRLLACGCDGGAVEFWDTRARRSVALHHVATEGEAVDVTALTWDIDGLTLGVGTSSGNCILYDIRSKVPVYTKEHQYGLPIVDITFHNNSRHIVSTDKKIVKIWERDEPNIGKIMTNIETPADINAAHVVSDKRGQSGLILLAGEQSKVMTYFVPQLGPAPRWCSFLEGLTEELDETNNNTVYEDYKFVTKAELEELGASALVGTPMLKGYMHGYFMEMKLYNKLRAVSKPFEYEEHRKKRIKEKIDEKRSSRIIPQKRLPKVNKELAEKLLRGKSRKSDLADDSNTPETDARGQEDIVDSRFSSLFSREEFQQDTESYEYRLRNPTLGANVSGKRRSGADDSDDDMYKAVEEDEEDEDEYDEDREEGDGSGSDSDLEIRNPDSTGEPAAKAKRLRAKALAKEIKRRKREGEHQSDDEEDGAIMRASAKAAAKAAHGGKRMYELSEAYAGSKSGPLGLGGADAKAARKKERERGAVPLAERLESRTSNGTNTNTRVAGGSKYAKELSYIPKEKGNKAAKKTNM